MANCMAIWVKKKTEMIPTVALPEISEELLIEILMRLPAKTLMRFKCVSTMWRSLISSRYFTNRFLKSSSRQRLFAYTLAWEKQPLLMASSSTTHVHSDTSVSVVDQHVTMPGVGSYLVSVARGLACFREGTSLRICNLHTRQVVELPTVRSETIWIQKDEMWNYFGYDHVHDEYKVLSIVWEPNKKENVDHLVLVLGAGASWRKVQCHFTHCPNHPNSEGIIINGVLYYQALTNPDDYGLLDRVVMSFDLSSEEFNLTELPNTERIFYNSLCTSTLINYKGNIAVLDYYSNLRHGTRDVWFVAEKSKLWEKKTFVLPVSQLNLVHRDVVTICGTSHSGKVWLRKDFLRQNEPTHFFIYDLERSEIVRSIKIRPLRDMIKMILIAIGCSQFFDRTYLWQSTFWDDIENIMYLET